MSSVDWLMSPVDLSFVWRLRFLSERASVFLMFWIFSS